MAHCQEVVLCRCHPFTTTARLLGLTYEPPCALSCRRCCWVVGCWGQVLHGMCSAAAAEDNAVMYLVCPHG